VEQDVDEVDEQGQRHEAEGDVGDHASFVLRSRKRPGALDVAVTPLDVILTAARLESES
jgi:hypothetical protein